MQRLRDGAETVARALLRAAVRLDVRGADHVTSSGALIIVANHARRFRDPLVLNLAAPRRLVILAHSDFNRRPLVGLVSRLSGAIFVTPSMLLGPGVVGECERSLGKGRAIGLFPEGREMGDGEGVFKRGAAYLAQKNRCPVLPARIEQRGIRRFSVAFGLPLMPPTGAATPETLDRFTRQLQEAIRALGQEARAA